MKAKVTYQRGTELVTAEGELVGETPDFIRLLYDHSDVLISKAFIIDLTRGR